MTKEDLAKRVAQDTNIAIPIAREAVESVIETIKDSIIDCEPVFLRGFGTFNGTVRKEKIGRNIGTGAAVVIPEHIVPTFKASKEFITKCNK